MALLETLPSSSTGNLPWSDAHPHRQKNYTKTETESPSEREFFTLVPRDVATLILRTILQPSPRVPSAFERWWQTQFEMALVNSLVLETPARDIAFCEQRKQEIKTLSATEAMPVFESCFAELQSFSTYYGQLSELEQKTCAKLLLDTVRVCPGVSVFEGTRKLLKLNNVGVVVAEAIITDMGNRCYQWGDLNQGRRQRYGQKTKCDDAQNRLDSVFGYNNALFEFDREMGQEVASHLTLHEIAALVGVQTLELTTNKTYQSIIEEAQSVIGSTGSL